MTDLEDEKINNSPLSNKYLAGSLLCYSVDEVNSLNQGFRISRGARQPANAVEIVELCKEGVEYQGYISAVKARLYKNKDGMQYYQVRIVCHLIVDEAIAEFCCDFSPAISSTSKLAKFLVKFGIPVFNIENCFEFDNMVNRPIKATLKQVSSPTGEIRYYLDEINPRRL